MLLMMKLFKERELTIFINCFGRSQWRKADTLGGREVSFSRTPIWSQRWIESTGGDSISDSDTKKGISRRGSA